MAALYKRSLRSYTHENRGGASRFALHGVPRVEPGTCPAELVNALRARPLPHANAMADFIVEHRININLRVAACDCEAKPTSTMTTNTDNKH